MRTRRRLLEAALAMFSDKGIDATTIEDITEQADLGKGTFYRHFSSKEEVVLALVESAVDDLIACVQQEGGDPPDLEGVLSQLLRGHSKFFLERSPEFILLFQGRVLLKLQRGIGEDLEHPYVRYLEEIEKRLSSCAPQPIDPARVRRLSCAVAGFVSGFFSFAMIGMTEEEIEKSLAPLRRAFVAASSTFLVGDAGGAP